MDQADLLWRSQGFFQWGEPSYMGSSTGGFKVGYALKGGTGMSVYEETFTWI